jgi:hypothetical protein
MNTERVDQIMQYALAVAAQADDPWDHQLGAIHLIKYVYLADLAYAEHNNGQTFTGVDWKFYHYGPWAPSVNDRVSAVVNMLGASEHVFSSTKYEKDSIRWGLSDREQSEQVLIEMDSKLPTVITSKVRSAIRAFGHDTTGLLHHVYSTKPMLRAAPGEWLGFDGLGSESKATRTVETPVKPSVKAQKKEKELFEQLQAGARAKLEEVRARRVPRVPNPPPRYDEVFEEGRQWLDSLEGSPLEEIEGEVEIADDVWKDPWRSEPDVA